MTKDGGEPTTIASVKKALAILDLFAGVSDRGGQLGVTEISRQLGYAFATTHHLVATLANSQYLDQDPQTRRYRLGVRALVLGLAARESLSLVGLAQPVIEDLAETVNEHVNLAILDGSETIYVSQVLSSRTIAMFMRLGTKVPMHCTGVGKAILAYLPPDQAERLAGAHAYQAFTSSTLTSWRVLQPELASVRCVGYAVDRGEREEGVLCVAAPVFDHNGRPCAAISVSGPSTRMDGKVAALGGAAKAAAAVLSAKLGHEAR